ncbi:3'-5' exonuclease [Vibrio coralliilyticus]|uniref:3'-5' exonuclease n=1 Tax=Vibrio coralliilyticus TaxID=190893 RepID=UPI00148CDAAB|nr:3'-5' exonuclease [Vibrio coralliilyticus]NOI20772.1 3'-5' exonuclease [Vibrio coralliilyticus]
MNTLDITNAVILDTETTGLHSDARIVEISLICAVTGDVLFNELVNPLCPIPADAQAVHGISDEDVANKRTFDNVWNDIKVHLFEKQVLIYNFFYDYRLIEQSLSDFDYPTDLLRHFITGECAMLWYAEYFGDWNDYHGNYRWQKLVNACEQQGVDTSDLTAHRALADCEMTRRLIHAVNAKLGA